MSQHPKNSFDPPIIGKRKRNMLLDDADYTTNLPSASQKRLKMTPIDPQNNYPSPSTGNHFPRNPNPPKSKNKILFTNTRPSSNKNTLHPYLQTPPINEPGQEETKYRNYGQFPINQDEVLAPSTSTTSFTDFNIGLEPEFTPLVPPKERTIKAITSPTTLRKGPHLAAPPKTKNPRKKRSTKGKEKVLPANQTLIQFTKGPQAPNFPTTTTATFPNHHEGLIRVRDVGLEEFFSFDCFNDLQSNCFDTLWNSNQNMIISAPTGSGKTVLFEIAMARYILKKNEFSEGPHFKIVYIAPIKALCQQKYNEWDSKFTKFNLKILELTGDTEITDFTQYLSSNIIITTPEKWDSITRRWKDNNRMVSHICLLMIDEVHLLNTEDRGATLEAVVSRMKIISKSEELKDTPAAKLRIIAVSATIPNIVDLGEWLDVPPECIKEFGDEYRSTPIEKHVFGYNMPKNEFQFEKSLNYRLVEIIRKFSSGKPTLVFCQTQKGTIGACEQIINDIRPREFTKNDLQLQKLIESSHQISDKNLQRFITHGVAFHNAGMTYDDRRLVEELFINNLILVICTTSTLAMGVNLPARLVIIKSTLCYRGAGIGYTEYSPIEIEQMIGRAGRPQFDTHGVVVIMTEKGKLEKYRRQCFEKDSLESHFSEKLAEHINAEISLRSIKSLDMAISYLRSTFLHVRIKKNPIKYGITNLFTHPEAINDYLMNTSKQVIEELHKYEMIQYNNQDGKVHPLELGIDMSRFYVSFNSMKKFFENHAKQEFKDLLGVLSEAQEFEKFRSRQDERKSLSALNTRIKYPLTGAISTSAKKAYVLIQASIGNVPIDDWELKRQTTEIMNTSWKIMQCFKRFYTIKKFGQGLVNSIKLIKYISMRSWDDNPVTILKQLPGIGDKFAAALCDANLENFDKLLKVSPYMIEMACNKNPPFGVQVQKKIEALPRIQIQPVQASRFDLKFKVNLNEKTTTKAERNDSRSGYYFIVQDKSHKVELFRYISLDEGLRGGLGLVLPVPNLQQMSFPLYAVFVNERFLGIDFLYIINENGTCFRHNGDLENIMKNQQPQLQHSTESSGEKIKSASKGDKEQNITAGCSHSRFN